MGWSGIKDYGFGGKFRTKEEDEEYRKRIGGVPRARIWTKEKCVQELEEILTIFRKVLREDEKLEKDNPKKLKRENVKDLVTMMNRVLEFMKMLYPPVQTNVNVNIDMTASAVIERLKEWKKKKGEIVVEEVK